MTLPGFCLSLFPFPLPSCAASEDPGKLLAACCLGSGARNRRRKRGTDRTTISPTALEKSRSLRDLATFIYYSDFFSFLLSLPLSLTDHHHYELSAPIVRSSGSKHQASKLQACRGLFAWRAGKLPMVSAPPCTVNCPDWIWAQHGVTWPLGRIITSSFSAREAHSYEYPYPKACTTRRHHYARDTVLEEHDLTSPPKFLLHSSRCNCISNRSFLPAASAATYQPVQDPMTRPTCLTAPLCATQTGG
ncbi:hypothetical protein CCHR01_02939 [Colletotrichum chrysophilum]|uniref:Secreted protein n=1 Tax=Colletotrichum chrysophilum TaxID=1836956 RepID=A0AAD9ATU4_9PEZI|nr:hypothetical protein CCHR01_02939 [Colletotrichum chrysophilum]